MMSGDFVVSDVCVLYNLCITGKSTLTFGDGNIFIVNTKAVAGLQLSVLCGLTSCDCPSCV
jgi:hypothetical protein